MHGAIVGAQVFYVDPHFSLMRFLGLGGGCEFGGLMLLVPLAALIALGAWMGHHAANFGLRHMPDHNRLRDAERFDATPRRLIREIAEGPVRVRGFIRAVAPTINDQGNFCVACESLLDGALVATPRQSRGGVFELVDGDGNSTWVDARHVSVVDGMEFDGERVVPPGVVIELWALATSALEGQTHTRGYRDAATAWVLQGTVTQPVVMRVV